MSENDKDRLIQQLQSDLKESRNQQNKDPLTFAWLAGILLTLVIGGGAWWTNGISQKVDHLTESQSIMRTDVEVIKNQVGTILKESK
jgi:hypothetical protein